MKRNDSIKAIQDYQNKVWDILVIGGGATGLGVALDGASRAYKTLLIEKVDFAKGTSSRSTKLVHGGVRYLAQGNISLVREALRERGLLLKNAPHLVKTQQFLIPSYSWWQGAYYTMGLKMYDSLSGKYSFGKSIYVSRKKTLQTLPNLKNEGLKGGIIYSDGQFDDSRLALSLAQSIEQAGGTVVNYMQAKSFLKSPSGRINGVVAEDLESGQQYEIRAKAVVNATGVFVDEILKMDNPLANRTIKPSQGVHLVLDKSFLASDTALMIPKTSDGRVLFIIPWHHKVVVGTTDTPVDSASFEPRALEQEVDFILKTAQAYLQKKPQAEDVLSVFAGLRPLAAPQGKKQKTKEISRNHKIVVSKSHLITITGGKWTTYRKMGEDVINEVIQVAGLNPQKCITRNLKLYGYETSSDKKLFQVYGSAQVNVDKLILENPDWGKQMHENLDIRPLEVIWAVRNEMARTVEDVLARRSRCLFLDARASQSIASQVAQLMAQELGKDQSWVKQQVKDFEDLVNNYML